MYYKDLNQVSNAPECGQMLAYTRKQVIFQKYTDLEEVRQKLEDAEILELHLFNHDKEYRAIASRSPRFQSGLIETVVQTADSDESEIYQETVELEEEFGTTMDVLNHIRYDSKSGMAYIDNYRLRMGDERNG